MIFDFEDEKILHTNCSRSKLKFAEAVHINLNRAKMVNSRNEGAVIESQYEDILNRLITRECDITIILLKFHRIISVFTLFCQLYGNLTITKN